MRARKIKPALPKSGLVIPFPTPKGVVTVESNGTKYYCRLAFNEKEVNENTLVVFRKDEKTLLGKAESASSNILAVCFGQQAI